MHYVTSLCENLLMITLIYICACVLDLFLTGNVVNKSWARFGLRVRMELASFVNCVTDQKYNNNNNNKYYCYYRTTTTINTSDAADGVAAATFSTTFTRSAVVFIVIVVIV